MELMFLRLLIDFDQIFDFVRAKALTASAGFSYPISLT